MKQLIKKSIIQILRKLETPIKQTETVRKTQRNLLNPTD